MAPPSGVVFATTITRSARMPLEMNVLEPFSSQWSPLSSAVVRMPWRSEPAPGSVMAMAVISEPSQNPGSQRRFCSSVASPVRYGPTMSLCRPSASPAAPARVNSSARTAL